MIDLEKTENWIQVCTVEQSNELQFTREYLALTECLGWDARKFAAQLVAGWEPGNERLLDYFGPDDVEEDWYTGIDGEPMDVCEVIPDKLAEQEIPAVGLDADWHRDLYRAKLASLRIPKKLIEQYVTAVQKKRKR